MSKSAETLASKLEDHFAERLKSCVVRTGEVTLEVLPVHLLGVAMGLREGAQFRFAQLMDVCGVDYSAYGRADWETSETATRSGFSRGVGDGEFIDRAHAGARFATVYHLLSIELNQRVRLKTPLDGEPPRVPSVVEVWSSANWFEREAFDLYGILFEGHPDLRRLLTDYGFIGHPFRKDFPLIGNVEVRYDADKRRVVYEPVSIEPRTLVPRVIRHDHRYVERAEPPGESTGNDA